MNLKKWINNGLSLLRGTTDKDQVVKKIKRMLESSELSTADLDSIVSSIDGKLWEEEIKKRIQEQNGNKLWTMEELEQLYEDEIDALNAKIDQLQIDKDYLAQTNLELNAKAEALTGAMKGAKERQYERGLLRPCNEKELYDGEIKEILLDTLTGSLKITKQNSRRYDVLKSILDANEYDGKLKEKQDTVKSILKDSSGATERVAAQLKSIGLQLESEGKHAKFSYYGDKRYMATLAKTASDKRSGMNIANTIIDMML